MRGRNVLAGLGALLVIAMVITAGYRWPETLTVTVAETPTDGEVVEQTTVCPGLRVLGDGSEAVTAFVDPAAPSSTGRIEGSAAGTIPLPDPGQAVRMAPAGPGGAISITATDGAVRSTASVREYLDRGEEGRGLALASCVPVRAQWWFVGVSATPGQIDELLLANPTDSPAVVSLDVFGPAGPIDLVGGGLVVQPQRQAAVRVDSLIPGTSDAAIRVSTSGGLVAAALRSTAIDGLIPLGASMIPAAAEPGTRLVVPGVAAGSGQRELVLTAGERDAAVELTFLTETGDQNGQGDRLVPVPAGHVISLDIAGDLQGSAGAVLVESSQPVTAAVRSTEAATLPPDATGVLNRVPVADYAWTSAQAPVQDRLVLPLASVAQTTAAVLLSSPDGTVTLRVTTRSQTGAASVQEIVVREGVTEPLPVPVTEGAASLITVERIAGDASWHAAVVQSGTLDERPLLAADIGSQPLTTVRVPPAHPDLGTALGG